MSIPTDTTALPLVVGQKSDRLRVLSLNVYMKPGEANIPPDLSPNDDTERATTIGRRILDDPDGYDVVLFNELFTDEGQVAMRDTLKPVFPYYVMTRNNGPVTTNNAGLAVFSRFPPLSL